MIVYLPLNTYNCNVRSDLIVSVSIYFTSVCSEFKSLVNIHLFLAVYCGKGLCKTGGMQCKTNRSNPCTVSFKHDVLV
jgi:hypothetical protein